MQMPGLNLKGIQLFGIHDAIFFLIKYREFGCTWSKNPSTYFTSNIILDYSIG